MNYVNNLRTLQGVEVATKYYVDFVCEFDNDHNLINSYHQIVRTEDDAILYANSDIRQIYAECFLRGINRTDVTII